MSKILTNISLLLIGILLLANIGCSRHSAAWQQLEIADAIMEERPDSALSILSAISPDSLLGNEEKAKYALLKAIALDKNYIDTTNLEVIQPAIAYYLKKGCSNEKLRSLYYEGRIYQNRKEFDKALEDFLLALDLTSVSDTLTLARLNGAIGAIQKDLYDFNSSLQYWIKAANFFENKGYLEDEGMCLLGAFDNALLLKDRELADSLYNACSTRASGYAEVDQALRTAKFSYLSKFGSKEEIHQTLSSIDINEERSSNEYLHLAQMCRKAGELDKAEDFLGKSRQELGKEDMLEFYAVAVPIFKKSR